jgi:LSD1 subclass zinc finger protein
MSGTTTNVVSVRCNHCGAPLEVSSGARFLTCSYCNAQLEVHRSGGAVFTEEIAQISQRTERIEQAVQQIKRQNAIEQLDREWQIRRQELMVLNKDGSRDVPTAVGGAIGGVIAVVVGIVVIVGTTRGSAPPFFPLIGLLFIGVGVVTVITQLVKAEAYSREEAAYRARRAALLKELESH